MIDIKHSTIGLQPRHMWGINNIERMTRSLGLHDLESDGYLTHVPTMEFKIFGWGPALERLLEDCRESAFNITQKIGEGLLAVDNSYDASVEGITDSLV